MNIALLFDWQAYADTPNYWEATRALVFGAGVIQRSGRHMKVSVGDVFVGRTSGRGVELHEVAFRQNEWRLVQEARLAEAGSAVFAIVFENMPRALAAELNQILEPDAGYLGAVSVHYEFGPHLQLFRSHLPSTYRIKGQALRRFYSMGNEDGCEPSELEDMRRLGYVDLGFEDRGASRTILDDFDTPRHFQRVAAFRNLMTSVLPGGEDAAYELVMALEDLSPKLFNALGAAAERLAGAETEEDVAQVALSGRRYMEQLADALFPPQDSPRQGRPLTATKYRNRLWALIEDNAGGDPAILAMLGAEVDRVVKELNGGLHDGRAKDQMALGLASAASLTNRLFSLNSDAVRQPYQPYAEGIRSFFRAALAGQDGRDGHLSSAEATARPVRAKG